MERGGRLDGGDDGDVLRQRGVQRLGGALERRARADLHRHDVRERVDASIGSTGDRDVAAIAVDVLDRLGKHFLDGALTGLPSPSSKGGAVIGNRKLQPHVTQPASIV